MKQGNATWTTLKIILGWLIDTTAKTIKFPPHRIERLREILEFSPRPEDDCYEGLA